MRRLLGTRRHCRQFMPDPLKTLSFVRVRSAACDEVCVVILLMQQRCAQREPPHISNLCCATGASALPASCTGSLALTRWQQWPHLFCCRNGLTSAADATCTCTGATALPLTTSERRVWPLGQAIIPATTAWSAAATDLGAKGLRTVARLRAHRRLRIRAACDTSGATWVLCPRPRTARCSRHEGGRL